MGRMIKENARDSKIKKRYEVDKKMSRCNQEAIALLEETPVLKRLKLEIQSSIPICDRNFFSVFISFKLSLGAVNIFVLGD